MKTVSQESKIVIVAKIRVEIEISRLLVYQVPRVGNLA